MSSERPYPVTMAEVARQAGVSISTVSRVLSASPCISAATAARVRATIDALGYRVTPAFAALGHRRHHVTRRDVSVALLPFGRAKLFKGEFGDTLRARLAPRGYVVDRLPPDSLGTQLGRALAWRGYSAAVLVDPPPCQAWDLPDWSRLAVVAFRPVGLLPFHAVRFAYNLGAQLAVRRALELGYRRIGLAPLCHDPANRDDHDRLGGAFSEHCLLTGRTPAIPPLLAPVTECRAVVPWFERHRPDVIIGFNRILIDPLEEAGYQVRRDFGFIALVQTPPAPHVTGLSADHVTAGEVVAEMIERKVRRGLFGAPPFACETMVPMRWTEGREVESQPRTRGRR